LTDRGNELLETIDRGGFGDPENLDKPGAAVNTLLPHVVPRAAIGYSILYLLFGGGLGGAVLIFIVAKMFGK
jgi:hypothetical protein